MKYLQLCPLIGSIAHCQSARLVWLVWLLPCQALGIERIGYGVVRIMLSMECRVPGKPSPGT